VQTDGTEHADATTGVDLETGTTTGTEQRRRGALAIGSAAVICATLLIVIVVLAGRGKTVTASVEASEAIPGTTLPPIEVTPTPEVTTQDTTPSETASPAEHPEGVNFTVTRPSFVLQGRATGRIPVYNQPGGGGVKITLPNPRAINNDPNASVPLVLLQKQEQGDWIEAYLPVRPNGSTGWVRRSDFTVSSHDYLIEVRLSQYRLRVLDGDRLVMNTTIGVATDNSPTPGGLYYTTELLAPPDPGGPYGPYAYGLSGYSNVYQSFGGGPGQLGLHGTNQPGALGRKVSHGCIRMSNNDITTLAKLLPLGVPVAVYP